MYCTHCGERLYYRDPNNSTWCSRCRTVVQVSSCKVSFWNLMAVLTLAWTAQVGI